MLLCGNNYNSTDISCSAGVARGEIIWRVASAVTPGTGWEITPSP